MISQGQTEQASRTQLLGKSRKPWKAPTLTVQSIRMITRGTAWGFKDDGLNYYS